MGGRSVFIFLISKKEKRDHKKRGRGMKRSSAEERLRIWKVLQPKEKKNNLKGQV